MTFEEYIKSLQNNKESKWYEVFFHTLRDNEFGLYYLDWQINRGRVNRYQKQITFLKNAEKLEYYFLGCFEFNMDKKDWKNICCKNFKVKISFDKNTTITKILQSMTNNYELFNKSSSTRHILLDDFKFRCKETNVIVKNIREDELQELSKLLYNKDITYF